MVSRSAQAKSSLYKQIRRVGDSVQFGVCAAVCSANLVTVRKRDAAPPPAASDLTGPFSVRMSVGGVGLERDGKVGVHLDGPGDGRVSRLEVIEGPSGRRRRTKAERARVAAESLVPGASVTDVARQHGTTRWQVYDWRKKLRTGQLVVPESVAALPMFAELVVEGPAAAMPAETEVATGVEIVVGDVVIRVGADADEILLTRSIRAARTATS